MKISSPLSSLVMKPYPLFTLNHLTFPVTLGATKTQNISIKLNQSKSNLAMTLINKNSLISLVGFSAPSSSATLSSLTVTSSPVDILG